MFDVAIMLKKNCQKYADKKLRASKHTGLFIQYVLEQGVTPNL